MGVTRMLKRIRKLVGGSAWVEARAALHDANQSLEAAESQAIEVQELTDRILEHGRRNHFGERLEAEMRRRYAT